MSVLHSEDKLSAGQRQRVSRLKCAWSARKIRAQEEVRHGTAPFCKGVVQLARVWGWPPFDVSISAEIKFLSALHNLPALIELAIDFKHMHIRSLLVQQHSAHVTVLSYLLAP